MSVVTLLPEGSCKHQMKATCTPTNSLKSMDSIYTASSKFSALSRRKGIQKNRDRHSMTLVPAVSEIKQRVTSARMLRMKQLQNQIGEAHHRISELAAENRLLKSLHKRQDSALSKYENTSAELPTLLNSHAEELRMWQTRCRNLQRQNKELTSKVKQKDNVILTMSDQNKQLLSLNKDKSLLERANLQDRVKDLELRLTDKENELKLLARRLQLETKSFRSNLQIEQQKYRDLLMKIEMSDFLLSRDNKKSQHSMKTTAKLVRNPSPNRLTSKSATTLSTVNGSSSASDQQSLRVPSPTTILPPCETVDNNSNIVKKPTTESIKQNSPCVNGNVKLMPEMNGTDHHHNEINLTKNCIDRSEKMPAILNVINNDGGDEEDDIIAVKNGMNRARRLQQQQQHLQQKSTVAAKLAPINAQQQQTNNSNNANSKNGGDKKSSDDSEFSDDDDLHFFSNHNGTKMAHNNNNTSNKIHAKELLDHKLHINELEDRMRRNSLDVKSYQQRKNSFESETSSTSPDTMNGSNKTVNFNHHKDDISFNDRGDSEIMTIRRHDSHRESLLDDLCDSLADKNSHFSPNAKPATYTRIKKLEFIGGGSHNINTQLVGNGNSYETLSNNNHVKSNGVAVVNRRMDEKKKTNLLATLKQMDLKEHGSFEN